MQHNDKYTENKNPSNQYLIEAKTQAKAKDLFEARKSSTPKTDHYKQCIKYIQKLELQQQFQEQLYQQLPQDDGQIDSSSYRHEMQASDDNLPETQIMGNECSSSHN